MKSDWHPARISKQYRKNWGEIIWNNPSEDRTGEKWEVTIKGTSGPYKWRKGKKNEME